MSVNGKHGAQVYACPDCEGKLVVSGHLGECSECGPEPIYG